jgi:hypothetical protein
LRFKILDATLITTLWADFVWKKLSKLALTAWWLSPLLDNLITRARISWS